MNYARLILAALAATVGDAIYGFIVYGNAMTSEFARYPGVYRSADSSPMFLPLMFAGIFVAMIAVVAIYAKGYEGGSGIAEGIRFGLLFGIFAAGFLAGVDYGTLNIGKKLTLMLACAGVVEWTIAGAIIGLVYRPAALAKRPSGV
jgi:hypothetical protein